MEQLQATFHDATVRIVDEHPVTVVLKDVANVVGYTASNLKRAIKPKYRALHEVKDTTGRKQNMICVTRPGLSQALATLTPQDPAKRRKVEAFQDWLYEDVLESIYDTGSYTHEPQEQPNDPVLMLAQATTQIREEQIALREEQARAREEREQGRRERKQLEEQIQTRQLSEDTGTRSCESMRQEAHRLVRDRGHGSYQDRWHRVYDALLDRIGVDMRVKYKHRGSKSILSQLTTNEMGHLLKVVQRMHGDSRPQGFFG